MSSCKKIPTITLTTVLMSIVLMSVVLAPVAPASAQVIPREEMLIIGGAYWEMPPAKFNVLNYPGSSSGIVGLIYEPLYIWIPIKPEKEQWFPWLAEDLPRWIDQRTVEIKIKPQARWWDGRPVTASDVKFSFLYVPQKIPGVPWGGMANYIQDIEIVDEKTVRIKFVEKPNYADFLFQLYSAPILPEHFLKDLVDTYGGELLDAAKWPAVAPGGDQKRILASGMYRYKEHGDDYFILERVDTWWGREVFGLPAPKYIKGVVIYSNQVAANMLGAGLLDWSCFYIPGGPDMVKRGLAVAYLKKEPYYLSANVAYLFVNTEKPPFNDKNFRKALYFAIDVKKIIASAFEGAVLPSNPVGLLPVWEEYLATDLIAKYGYRYNPDIARAILTEAGYRDCDRDGWIDTPDCKPIRITIIVPYGWTDWMFAIINIAEDLRKVGIYAEAQFPDFGGYITLIDNGQHDAAINNFGSFTTPSPYTLFNWAFRVEPGIWRGNHGRYRNPELNALIDELGTIHPANKAEIRRVLRQIQEILLEEMPALPLWYNGYWFLASEKYWIGWPSEDNPYGVPTIWNGQWQHGGMLVLLRLRPVVAPTPPTPPTPAPTVTTVTVPVTVTVPGLTVTVTTTAAAVTVTVSTTVTVAAAERLVTTTVPGPTVTTTAEVTRWDITAVVAVIVAVICVAATYFIIKKK